MNWSSTAVDLIARQAPIFSFEMVTFEEWDSVRKQRIEPAL